jgi:hypothetical protein
MQKWLVWAWLMLPGWLMGQTADATDQQRIERVIQHFFDALETRDTALMRSTTLGEAQIWRRINSGNPTRVDVRLSKNDTKSMANKPAIREQAIRMDIQVRDGIAVAWVPYKLWVGEEFSHCGVDVFTLFNIHGEWKIVTAAYTVEQERCDDYR